MAADDEGLSGRLTGNLDGESIGVILANVPKCTVGILLVEKWIFKIIIV